ncbi:hypothetical protein DICTH_1824 [Dictyoglomus thermophilum H-6-12]|uniref:Uncharacterized protein n=1 Tax=Dictyoglomus thermophilum (strain ATCC 35947 / DSM 3960 / H-6-12) TaxID=309799 RepID=B5YBA7_DICT6|nr:hypothetical protein DICTH_1824 [Dictyoglomus thermophilum H-6-12]
MRIDLEKIKRRISDFNESLDVNEFWFDKRNIASFKILPYNKV